MAGREDITLVGGKSKRAVERKLFGSNLRISMSSDTDKVTRRLVRGYGRAWDSLQGVVHEMAQDAAEAKHDGRLLSAREIARLDRVDRAQFAITRQIRELTKFTGVEVTGAATSGIGRVVADVLDTVPSLAGVDRRFTKPSGAAMEGLILRSTGRIESATRALDAQSQIAVKEALFRGLVLGENPTETAKQIVSTTETAFFGGLSRANTIARTEIADAHRYATRLAYNDEDMVVGWKWLATLSTRTCPACWAMHNTFHEKSEIQFAHQNCRCTQVPVLVDDIEADHDLGDPEQIFWGLPREDQLAIMGPGRLKALEGGARFSDLAFLQHNAEWRPSYHPTSVADLTGLAELNIATTPGDVITVPGLTNESILSYAFAQGGLTINAATGEQPTSGYVVARQGTSAVIDAREFFGPAGPNAVAQWLRTHGDQLDAPGAHMGMWYDTHNGKVVLDVVQILDDKDAAIALGRAEDQIAIFDLNTFSEISTGGSGGYARPDISSSLRPDGVTVGKTVSGIIDGVEFVGKVKETPGYSDITIVETADGETIRVWPDQIKRVESGTSDVAKAEVERTKELRDIAAEIAKTTGIETVNLAGMDLDDAREVAATIEKLHEDYPGVDPVALHTGAAGTAYAVTNTSFPPAIAGQDASLTSTKLKAVSDVAISDYYAANSAEWSSTMQGAEDRGHFHSGTADEPQQYTVDHEFGHVLDFNLWGHPGFNPDARFKIAAEVYNNLYADDIKQGRREPLTLKKIKDEGGLGDQSFFDAVEKDLSGYATQDMHEMFAEAFAVYRDHGPGESIVADTIMRHYVRDYRAKYGHWPHERDLERLLPGEYQPDGQGALFSEKVGQMVSLREARPGLRVSVNGRYGEIAAVAGGRVRIKFDDGTIEDVHGADMRHALRR